MAKEGEVNHQGFMYTLTNTQIAECRKYLAMLQRTTHTTNRIKNVIFRGLCWCDLMEFFSANDSSIIEMSNMKGFLYNIIKTLNSDNVDMEQIQPYIVEYAELWARLNRIISIEQVAFKI